MSCEDNIQLLSEMHQDLKCVLYFLRAVQYIQLDAQQKNTETPLGCVSKASHSSYLTSLHRSNDGNTMTHSRQQFHRHSSNHPERSPWRHTGNKWRCYWGHGGGSVFQHSRRSEHIYFWSDKVSHVLLASNAWYFLNHTQSESIDSAETLSQLHCHQSWRIV